MTAVRLTKRFVDGVQPSAARYTIFDDQLKGFGLRVSPSGEMSWIVEYRPHGGGRGIAKRKVTLGTVGALTPDKARKAASKLLAQVRLGADPAEAKQEARRAMTVAELAACFLGEHVDAKRKLATQKQYRDVLKRLVLPEIGTMKANAVGRGQIAKLHLKHKATPFLANRLLAVVGAMFAFGEKRGFVEEGANPARRIEKYREHRRERFLTVDELERVGAALREAETIGFPWEVDEGQANAKHLAKPENRRTVLGPHATAAIRLLILTGARLREILELRWEQIDFGRGLLLLPDSKTGQKAIVLNAPALSVLASLSRVGNYVIAGNDPEKPRADLHRPWRMIQARAGLKGVRIHDLRHTYASFGAASGLGLPVIGKLLGHREAATTQRYAHLDNDPLRRASGAIGATIAAAMGDGMMNGGHVLPLDNGHRGKRATSA